ncbi:MAG TPA: class I SAM-dependent methyltransferase [Chlamydiales bacterium]|nr:class I SAM-dependent methyltransferase [Chlamydiales bacterium]
MVSTVSVYGYPVNVGQAVATGLALAAVTGYAVKKMVCPPTQKPLSDTAFWERIETTPTAAEESGPFVAGDTTYPSVADAKRTIMLSCDATSEFVYKHLIRPDFKGTVLDLGGGTGANALPLVAKGCKVTLIEEEKSAIDGYDVNEIGLRVFKGSNWNQLHRAQTICADLTEHPYPKNVDAVICVDTLPYLPPAKLKATMDKIFQALRPGGKFIGTIYYKSNPEGDQLTESMGKLGAHFYPGKDFAREIVTRSGFQIKQEREDHYGGYGGFFSRSHRLEFLAEKPAYLPRGLIT